MSSFLERWSSRVRETRRAETQVPEAPPADDVAAESGAEALPEGEALERLLADLPALDSITSATDIRPFLQSFVPKALKNAALRRAWAADPVISTHLDVARDYAWDFNTGPGPVGYSAELGKDIIQKSLDLLSRTDPPEPVEEEAVAPQPEAEELSVPEEEGRNAADPTPLRLSLRHGGALPG
ncbi:DUF3306 domain-containing protein [Falsigemmobacter faecalis]|uniref:DUF3306 domain-containing protein n=1 Tax=Falsigemmobacter faecalis TaxID=2488730 RepID=A0A3P3DXJ1_9RHOB|nr:DUF3306 domain-containing protein [Falsigemmobacter faecalis]RRH78212.1 DUF3306 domain-containing protein [Falsigemmobacter faecalis]